MSATSADVHTAAHPRQRQRRAASIATIRPWATGERTTRMWSWCGKEMSAGVEPAARDQRPVLKARHRSSDESHRLAGLRHSGGRAKLGSPESMTTAEECDSGARLRSATAPRNDAISFVCIAFFPAGFISQAAMRRAALRGCAAGSREFRRSRRRTGASASLIGIDDRRPARRSRRPRPDPWPWSPTPSVRVSR